MSATAVMTSRERAAAQAYVRLLGAVRAALAEPPGDAAPPPVLLSAPMAEADEALAAAGLAGNEEALFGLVAGLHRTDPPGAAAHRVPRPARVRRRGAGA
ncbi:MULTISPECIES: hypothetical protein [unclassified Streptomyces]|uniref:hypothetical protein n=1 Tax=unclassified Streptomyces TaxID=2593676 RepID=UPI000F4585AE|nr:hypothetical protein [Streptomyces sp. I6]RNL73226.1 hypothetical protein EBF04_24285 [Streptomyces sp. I6]